MTEEEKNKKKEIQKEEIISWLEYFKEKNLSENDKEILDKLQKSMINIFKLEIEELGYNFDPNFPEKSDIVLNMINDSSKVKSGSHEYRKRVKYNGEIEKEKSIFTYNIYPLSNNLKSKNIETRLLACRDIFTSVFHEIQHERQWIMIDTSVSNKEAIVYARDCALKIWLKEDFRSFDIETGNYETLAVESDANEASYRKYLDIIGKTDKKTEALRDMELVKKSLGRYKINTSSSDGYSQYNSHGLQERDDISAKILDDLICNRRFTEILRMCPVLTKEYNMDGTKKSALDLIKNMELEIKQISENTLLDNIEKRDTIKDAKEMYYELIYRALEKATPNQLMQIKQEIGNEQSKEVFESMKQYFQKEKESKIKISEKMRNTFAFVPPSNNGTIQIEKDGEMVQASFYEFIKMVNPDLMKKKFIMPNGRTEIKSEEFLRRFGFQYLAQNGEMILKDGTKISAIQYVEEYMLQKIGPQLEKDYQMINLLEDTIQSTNGLKECEETKARVDKYYEDKKQFIDKISNKLIDEPKIVNQQGKVPSKVNEHINPQIIVKDTVQSNITKQEIEQARQEIKNENNKEITK